MGLIRRVGLCSGSSGGEKQAGKRSRSNILRMDMVTIEMVELRYRVPTHARMTYIVLG
jgi:hypothetical protein